MLSISEAIIKQCESYHEVLPKEIMNKKFNELTTSEKNMALRYFEQELALIKYCRKACGLFKHFKERRKK